MQKSYFNQKTIWITGASSGIGAALARALSAQGAFLIISSRREKELNDVKATCKDQSKVFVLPLDLANSQDIQEKANLVLGRYEIDILINNGGISQRSLTQDTPMEIDRKLMEVNYFGQIHLTKHVLKQMLHRKSGHIVAISSLTGKWGFYLRSAYAASKHALHGFFDSLRMEVENEGIHVTLITPGFIATEISKNAVLADGKINGEMDPHQANGTAPAECANQILKGLSLQKKEFGVGGKELLGLFLNRYFPRFFAKILRKQSAR
jgi:dehydrogenase/reductase SDR family protein 7B